MRAFLLSLILVISSLSLSACYEEVSVGAGNYERSMVASAEIMTDEAGYASAAPQAKRVSAGDMALDRSKFGNRRIAETHNLNVETLPDELKGRYDRDYRQCLALGCEVTNSNVSARRNGYFNARIAPEKLSEFLDFLAKGPGELKTHSVSADDKTLQYIDTQATLETQKALKERLLKLLDSEKAENVSQILQVEREITRVQQKIDSATGTLRHLETLTQLATVNVSYSVPYYDIEIRYHDLSQSMKRAYQQLLSNAGDVIVFIGKVLPWLPIWFLAIVLLVKTLKFAFGRGFRLLFWRKAKGEAGDVAKAEAKAKKKISPKIG